MLEPGPWPAYETWPPPEQTLDERYVDQLRSRVLLHFLRTRDPRRSVEDALEAVWFLCRYGMQSYRDVITWPVSELVMSVNILSRWIEREGPKTSQGPS